MQIPARSGHSRRASAKRPPPTAACQMFVTSDGTTRIAAACAGVIRSPSSPIDTGRQAKTDDAFDETRQQECARDCSKS